MTELLERAFRAARDLSASEQDAVGRMLLDLVAGGPVFLTAEERHAIARSKAAAARGDFATDDEVAAVWARDEP